MTVGISSKVQRYSSPEQNKSHLKTTGCMHLLYGITQCYLSTDTIEPTPP